MCHEATRTGAPFILLHLLRWLKEHSDFTWEVVFKDGGELLPEFEALSPVTVWRRPATRLQRLEERIQRRVGTVPDPWKGRRARRLTSQLTQQGADLVYSNTVANGPLLRALEGLKCPVICHAHELEFTINVFVGREDFALSHERTDHYIAASRAVKENLVTNHATPADKIDVVHEFVPTQLMDAQRIAQARQAMRRELGIAPDAPIVMGAGTLDWRKGSDLWVQVAAQVARHGAPAHFVWAGGHLQITFDQLQHDIAQLGLRSRVHLLGQRSDALNCFAAADVFAMTSREDPYPLVNLEAASVGTPIVCFAGAGGTPEFVEEDCGFVVPYLDTGAMAVRVTELLQTPQLRRQMGARAAQKVIERHDVAASSARVLAIIERCLSHAS